MTSNAHPRVGFIGCGKMAAAMAGGLVRAGFTTADRISGTDISEAARSQFQSAAGARVLPGSGELLAESDIVVLAVKPQQMADVLQELRGRLTARHLTMSIAAGVTIAQLEAALGADRRVIRVMPNTPALVQAGAAAFSRGQSATAADARQAQQLLSSLGFACEVPERLLDAVTGLSGSGPAYAFLMIEALSDGGVRAGLPREIALQLAAHTLLGAARMVLETGWHPGQLKDAVASPGGTTIAGLQVLEQRGVRGALLDAVVAATERSAALASKG
jgi:pyrroline-5-carboxylate reductase